MSTEKKYLGNLKESITFGENELIGTLNISKLKELLELWAFESSNHQEMINIRIVKRKVTGRFGQTHYIQLDENSFSSKRFTSQQLTA